MLSNLQFRDDGRLQDGVGLLTSILMRYCEVESIYYWREQHALKFTFIVKRLQDEISLNELLKPALEFFHQLEGQKMRVFDIICRSEEDVCIITITRDVNSMTQPEVGLIVELLKRTFKQQLIYDEMYLTEDEQLYQEELIAQKLFTIKSKSNDTSKNVVARREEGRVLVFRA